MGKITRSNGRSISANGAYITGGKIRDERTNIVHDYSRKDAHDCSINVPGSAPEWMGKRENIEKLLNYYEKCEDEFHKARFKADHNDLEKREKSLDARERAIANAQMGFTLEFSLQRELSKEQNLKWANAYIKENFTNRGFISISAVHYEEGNPHCHLLVLPRKWVGDGFDKVKEFGRRTDNKVENLFSKTGITKILRPSLENHINNAFVEAGLPERVTCKSYKDLGIDRIPGKHIGVYASKYLKAGEESILGVENKDIERRNFIKMLDDPSILLRKMSHSYIAFSKGDIEREVLKQVHNDRDKYIALCQKVDFYLDSKMPEVLVKGGVANADVRFDSKELLLELDNKVSGFTDTLLASKSVVNLGKGIGDIDRFTTIEQKESEERVLSLIDEVSSNTDFVGLDRDKINAGMDKALRANSSVFNSYSVEQQEAIEFLCGAGQLRVLEGKAGTGKTTVLKPVKEAYENAGYRVIGSAFQGKVAQNLGRDLGIESYTLASLQLHWREYAKYKGIIERGGLSGKELSYARNQVIRHSSFQLDNRSVLLVDEGSMVSQGDWSNLLGEISSKGSILRVVQDNAQIKSITGSNISRAVGEKAESYKLSTIYRQRADWQKQASSLINEHRFSEGLVKYEDNGDINYVDNLPTAIKKAAGIATQYFQGGLGNISIISKKNSVVNELNSQVFNSLSYSGHLGEKFELTITEEGKNPVTREFAIGAEIVFKKNDFRGFAVKPCVVKSDVVKSTSAFNNKDFNHEGKITEVTSKGVANGSLGKIISYDQKTGVVGVELRDSQRQVEFDSKKYSSIALGYAFTTNSEQGVTRDKVIAIPDRSLSAGDLTVMLTRHRDSIDIIANREYYKDFRSIGSGLLGEVGLIADYSVSKEQKPYLDLISNYKESSRQMYNHYSELNNLKGKDGKGDIYSKIESIGLQRESVARQIVNSWDRCNVLAGQAKLKLEDLEVVAGVRERQLSRFERLSLDKVEEYYSASLECRGIYKKIAETHKGVLAEHHSDHGEYLHLRSIRDSLAHEISKNPSLYKGFFKIRVNKDEAGNIQGYSSYRRTYENHPPRFNRLLVQAKSYEVRLGKDNYIESLSSEKKYIYEQLQVYRDSNKTAVSSYYHLGGHLDAHLDDNKDSLLPQVRKQIDAIGRDASSRRDLVAHSLIDRITASNNKSAGKSSNSSDKTSSGDIKFFEDICSSLSINSEKILNHSSLGSIRLAHKEYINSNDIKSRLSTAENLYAVASNSDGRISKQSYGLLTGLGVDANRLRFENSVAIEERETGKQIFNNLDSLNVIQSKIVDIRKLTQSANNSWLLVRQENRGAVEKLQNKFLDDLQESGVGKELRFKQLREVAMDKYLDGIVCNSNYKREELLVRAVRAVNSQLGALYSGLSSRDNHLSSSYNQLQSLGGELGYGYKGINLSNQLHGVGGSSNLDNWRNSKDAQIELSKSLKKQIVDGNNNDSNTLNKVLEFGRINTASFYRNIAKGDSKTQELSSDVENGTKVAEWNGVQSSKELQTSNPVVYSRQYSKQDIRDLCDDICTQTDVRWLAESVLQDKINSKLSNSKQIRFGKKGSLSFNLEKGTYKDFESDSGGNIIGFVKERIGTDFKGSLSYISSYSDASMQGRIDDYVSAGVTATQSGFSPAERNNESNQKRIEDAERKVLQEKLQSEYKLQCVRDLTEKRQPVSGTQAEKYLSSRGISLSGLSDDIGYIKAGTKFNYLSDGNKVERTIYNGALISVGRDNNKEITGVQLTYLKDGAKQQDKEGNPLTKRQYGTFTSSLVNVHNPHSNNTAIICEGLETACSIKESLGLDKSNDIGISIYASNGISNIKNIKDKNYKNIIIASDYDGVGAKTHDKIKLVSKELQESGNLDSGTCLSVLYPEHEKNSTAKIDYNDLLQSDNGKEKIYDQFTHEISKLDKDLHKEITEKNNLNVNIEKDKIAGNINESVITNDYSQKDKLQDKDVVSQDALADSDTTHSVSTQVPRDVSATQGNKEVASQAEILDISGENNPITDPKILSALSDLAKAKFYLQASSSDNYEYNDRMEFIDSEEEDVKLLEESSDKIKDYAQIYDYNKKAYNYLYGSNHLLKGVTIEEKAVSYVKIDNEYCEDLRIEIPKRDYAEIRGDAERNIKYYEQEVSDYINQLGINFNEKIDPDSFEIDKDIIDKNPSDFTDKNLSNEDDITSLQDLHKQVQDNDRFGIKDERLEEKYRELCLFVGRDEKTMGELRYGNNELADTVEKKVSEDDKQKIADQDRSPQLEM